MADGPLRSLFRRIKEHRVVAILGIVFGPLGVWLKRLINATDWVSRFDTWSLHRPAVPPWSSDFLRLLTPDLPLIGYVLAVGFLTLLFFARERRAAKPIPTDNSEVAAHPTPSAHKGWLVVSGLHKDPRETFRKQHLDQLEDRRLSALAEAAEEELRLKRIELARINDANLELDLELAKRAREKRREEEALGVLLRPVVDALSNPKPAISISPASVDAILGWQASRTQTPDVTLEFSSPGPFTLRNLGATACEVQIECDSLNESLIYEVAFPIVGDLHDAPIVVTPEIEPSALWSKDKDIMSVLRSVARSRAMRMQDPTGNNSNSTETSRIVSKMEPISFQLGVVYIDRSRSRKWRKSEVLVYDPSKERAYITHGYALIIAVMVPAK